MQINEDLMDVNEITGRSRGGTELMQRALYAKLPRALLEKFQIIFSRVRNLDPNRIPLYYLHDLPGDPESEHLRNGGWNRFRRLIFASNWQLQAYNLHYGVPYSKSVVLQNAIEPIAVDAKSTERIAIIYHTTPHRGLGLLVPAFYELADRHDEIELEVFSSFEIYGLRDLDKAYEKLFRMCREHPRIRYHGTQPNEVVREALARAHIFAYPSVWKETSCIALMEALSAQCLCIHPNLAALPETAANFSLMYQWTEDPIDHAAVFARVLDQAITALKTRRSELASRLQFQKAYADAMYSWSMRVQQWTPFLHSLLEATDN